MCRQHGVILKHLITRVRTRATHVLLTVHLFKAKGGVYADPGTGMSAFQRLQRYSSAWARTRDVLRGELDAIKAAGTWKSERVITSPQAAKIRVQGRDGEILNFCANNYLGLSVSLRRGSEHIPRCKGKRSTLFTCHLCYPAK